MAPSPLQADPATAPIAPLFWVSGPCGASHHNLFYPDKTEVTIALIAKADKSVTPAGHPTYAFDPEADLVLDKKTPLHGHANGMQFYAYDAGGRLLLKRVSIIRLVGGGFVVSDEELQRMKAARAGEAVKKEGAVPLCQCEGDVGDGGDAAGFPSPT